jgi:hypothetical protein
MRLVNLCDGTATMAIGNFTGIANFCNIVVQNRTNYKIGACGEWRIAIL